MLVSEQTEIRSRPGLTPRSEAQRQALYAEARRASEREDAAYRSFSGTDQAEAPAWSSVRDFYLAVAEGLSIPDAFAFADAKWRAYAAEQARKVADAPKIQRGPSAGHSSIHHRWVSPDHFAQKLPYLRTMAERALTD